jgi:hypothetical protein
MGDAVEVHGLLMFLGLRRRVSWGLQGRLHHGLDEGPETIIRIDWVFGRGAGRAVRVPAFARVSGVVHFQDGHVPHGVRALFIFWLNIEDIGDVGGLNVTLLVVRMRPHRGVTSVHPCRMRTGPLKFGERAGVPEASITTELVNDRSRALLVDVRTREGTGGRLEVNIYFKKIQ